MLDNWLFPGLIAALLCAAAWKRLPLYDLFVQGAKTGLHTAVQLIPNLAAMLCALSVMQTSGLMTALGSSLSPVMRWLKLPPELSALVIIRPLSGSGSLAALQSVLENCGADSRAGLLACTLMGSSETIFYTICVYRSAAGETTKGYAVPCSLLGMVAGLWVAGMLF